MSSFACLFDAGSITPCASPLTATSLSEGRHTFTVVATDPAGNRDPSPVSVAFLVRRTVVRAALMRTWTVDRQGTRVDRLVVALPNAEAQASVRCHGPGCPFAERAFPAGHRLVGLTRAFRGARLRPGAVIEVVASAPDMTSRVFRATVRQFPHRPRVDWLCQPPDNPRLVRCSQ
jgi:hypothetical protein